MKHILTIVLALLASGFISCNSQKKQAGTKAVMNRETHPKTDATGTYRGVLPCADCSGIKTEITLRKDSTYILRNTCQYAENQHLETTGKFSTDTNSGKIMFDNDTAQQYLLEGNKLFCLNRSGEKITGDLEEHYQLKKTDATLTGPRWKLIRLNDAPLPDPERVPFMILQSKNNKVTGNTGCNRFFGNFETEGVKHLKFGRLGMTKMACLGANPEREFIDVLEKTTYYQLCGTELLLKDKNKNILAVFEADYFGNSE